VRAIVVGNSLGGYTVLKTSAFHPELVSGCAVLNGAGAW
jgi:pimeloyl-ACP methyl ester carboxylesterase